MRKALAGKLIRLAHFIYPPRVTEIADITFSGPLANMEAARKYYTEAWRDSRGWDS